jgi:hypothetical protein
MLTIGKLGASVEQLAYYEHQVAQGIEDYFSGRGEAAGRSCGGIGVSGQVDCDGFMRAMDGCDPRTGERLRPEHGRTKVAAFDLTFSAPKSVSVLFAIAGEQVSAALLDAHQRAVEAAFRYVDESLEVLARAMRRREAERLALEAIEGLPMTPSPALSQLPLAELPEAGAEAGQLAPEPTRQAEWRAPGSRSRGTQRDQEFEHER